MDSLVINSYNVTVQCGNPPSVTLPFKDHRGSRRISLFNSDPGNPPPSKRLEGELCDGGDKNLSKECSKD